MAVRRNARGFAADLSKFSEMVEEDVSKLRRRVTIDLLDKLIGRSPVDTGRFRNSWFVSDGAPDGSSVGSAGAETRNISGQFLDPFKSSFITNNLPYATRLEFGYSGQAPMGMVRISVAEIVAEFGLKSGKVK